MDSIALLGGTGPEGRGLALRFAQTGVDVFLGSREHERAVQTAAELSATLSPHAGSGRIEGATNSAAVQAADVVCPVVPFRALENLLRELAPSLAGKTLLDVTNPINRSQGQFGIESLAAGSTAEWIQQLAPEATIVSAFKNLSAEELMELSHPLEGDILVCSDSPAATAAVIALAARIPGLRGIDAGPLRNARFLEGITALLMNLNRRHKTITSIRILGI